MAELVNSEWSEQQALKVSEASDVAVARRLAVRFAEKADFDELARANVALVATELASNLVKHAGGGRVLVQLVRRAKQVGVELIALDQSTGINDVAQSMRDGFSTAGSHGTGLGAMNRLSSHFEIFSAPGKGTAVLTSFWPKETRRESRSCIEIGTVQVPMPGQEVCGDGWATEALSDKCTCVLVDGLGHGPDAAAAAHAAIAIAHEYRLKAPAEILERAHDALRSTRGAAMAVAAIDTNAGLVHFCGVGNITAMILQGEQVRHTVSHNGTVGQEARKISEYVYPWSRSSLLAMHSDGLSARWDLKSYRPLAQRHPSLIAAVLYRDFARGRDDATVLVARENHIEA